MALLDQQIRIGDLVMGRGTSYRWLTETNPLGLAVRTTGGGPRASAHGTWAGAEFADERVITVEFLIDETSEAAALAAYDQAARVFAPVGASGQDTEFEYSWAGQERLIYGRPRGLVPDTSLKASGRIFCRAGFVASNPYRYDANETVAGPITPPVFVGGLTFPLTFPLTFAGSISGGEATITNVGTVDIGMLLRVDGRAVDPRIQVIYEDGSTANCQVDMTVLAGHWLEIDTAAHTVYLDGVNNQRGNYSGSWPLLPPGVHTLRYRATDSTGSTLTARARSAWW